MSMKNRTTIGEVRKLKNTSGDYLWRDALSEGNPPTILGRPVIELPAAAMSLAALLNESDFAVIALDDLQAHMLGADRDNAAVRDYHEMVHPAVFELLARMAKDAERRQKPLLLFGESAADPVRVPFYLGVGFRSFSIAPVRLRSVLKVLARYTVEECRRIAARILEAPRTIDVQKVLVGLETE